uniref:Uncharacterized protein n=1 Tax=Cajanus cajan TaxID=3821 RepID=A0A151RB21_CAJCA|nr:hypothetical protein KK1_038943 [Cajanus cajan]
MNDHILKELTAPNVVYQSWGIQYPDVEVNYELKYGLIQLFPKFHGLASENPHKHLKEFHVVCSTMRPHEVLEDHVKMNAFLFVEYSILYFS